MESRVDWTHERVRFELVVDSDGYPPASAENLWAVKLVDDSYRIDNIPFYAKGIAPGDIVSTEMMGSARCFKGILRAEGGSVFRIFVVSPSKADSIRSFLSASGLECEAAAAGRLIAVEIPRSRDISDFLDFLITGKESGHLDFEEGVYRHGEPTA